MDRSVEKTIVSDDIIGETECSLLKNILDHVADPIFVKNRKHQWIFGNRAFDNILGVSSFDYLGKTDTDYFPKEEVDVFWQKDDAVFEKGGVDINEEHLTDAFGNHHIISTKKSCFTMDDGEQVLVGIIRDVTALKEVDRLKNEFISMVSHELRTPLTSIRAALELLTSGAVCELPSEARQLIDIACRNSERLEHITNEMLDLEKISSGKLQLRIESVSVIEKLTRALQENSTYGRKYGVTFELGEVSAKSAVLADRGKLMQVLTNLLSNAAKFSPSGSVVRVNAYNTIHNTVVFEVCDCGVGIPDTFKPYVFDRFSQADASTTRLHEGAGLGLSITKKLVEAMHGTIHFESREHHGTTFFVELPAAPIASDMPQYVQAGIQ